ncbi:MAG: polysaccharide biosynthesis/export family protein [Pseudomonadota bacterium]|nr:polysaccharide biosynthesis/export family protein [Pseudomonadota bacterium]
MITWAASGLSVLALTACSVPRGSALSSEILSEQNSDAPSYQVVSVTRDNVAELTAWPVTGWKGEYKWLANPRGPQSQLIRTGDVVSVVVWDNQDNSLLSNGVSKQASLPPMVVSASGMIFMPYVGEVEIRNLTQPAARAKIQEAMTEVAPEAQVQLAVQQGAGNAADLVGGVSAPGSYPLPSRNYSILSLIAAGGGISPGLENPLVRLLRGGHVYEIRAEQLMADPNLNTILRGGDKVVVAEDDRFFTALGATGREEVVPFTRESLTAMEALSTVGGLSDSRADLKSVLVLRDYPVDDTVPTPEGADYSAKGPLQEQVVFAFDLTSADGLFVARKFEINPKDTVLGTETVVTSARTVLGLIGSVVGVTNAVNNLTE